MRIGVETFENGLRTRVLDQTDANDLDAARANHARGTRDEQIKLRYALFYPIILPSLSTDLLPTALAS